MKPPTEIVKSLGNDLLEKYITKLDKRDGFLWAHVSAVGVLLNLIPKTLIHPDFFHRTVDKRYVIIVSRFNDDVMIIYKKKSTLFSEWKELKVSSLPSFWQDNIYNNDDPVEIAKIAKKALNLKAFL